MCEPAVAPRIAVQRGKNYGRKGKMGRLLLLLLVVVVVLLLLWMLLLTAACAPDPAAAAAPQTADDFASMNSIRQREPFPHFQTLPERGRQSGGIALGICIGRRCGSRR